MDGKKTKAYLRIGDKRHLLDRTVTVVGREKGVHIQIEDPKASGRHALIIRDGDRFVLYDFKSSNGVRVDGKRVDSQTLLRDGQTVEIGRCLLAFDQPGSGPSTLEIGSSKPPDGGSGEETSVPPSFGSLSARVSNEELLRKAIEKDVHTLIRERPAEEDLISKLLILYKVSNIVNSIVDTDLLLDQIVDLALKVMSADRAFIMLVNPQGKLDIKVYRAKKHDGSTSHRLREEDQREGVEPDESLTFSRSIAESCFSTGEAVFTNDALADARFSSAKSLQIYNIMSAMCTPLTFRGSRKGVLYTDNRRSSNSFTSSDFLLLQAFAEQAAIAIENSLLLADLKASLEKINTQQEMLIQSEKMASMGHLAAGLAHEIRNPLTVLVGYVELFFMRHDATSPFFNSMRVMATAVNHMHEIVNGLLEFARKGPLQKKAVSVNQVVEETLRLAGPALSENQRLLVEKDLAVGLPDVMIDQRQIQQVFLNLVLNGMQAMPDGGTLRVRTYAMQPIGSSEGMPASHVMVAFEDTGIGIPQEKQSQIFQPFFTAGKKDGTGLGLTISKSIVENHRGTLSFTSAAGIGTSFLVSFPVGPDE